MAASNYNKIVYDGKTLIDLTGDTITAADLQKGVTAHDKSGATITGTSTKDSDTSDATVAVAEILKGQTAYARGAKLTGTMPNNGSVSKTISKVAQKVTIAQGYHDGTGSVSIDSVEQAKIIAANIREGVTILGVIGTMSGSESEKPESGKTITPTSSAQTIIPSTGYTCFKQVTVKAIPYAESDNSAGGITVTIG